jgi:AmmeMemoRadiSam system protein A
MTSDEDRRVLLQLARDAIVAHLAQVAPSDPPLTGAGGTSGGAFVTLHVKGELRGCIGHIEADEPLARVITRCAIAACSADPRFSSLASTELPDLSIELSLLYPLIPVRSPEEILVGRDGLVVEKGWQRGLLLPQVATEWNWDRETFLAHTCRKAGLPHDAWKHGARLWRFEAEVFSETS